MVNYPTILKLPQKDLNRQLYEEIVKLQKRVKALEEANIELQEKVEALEKSSTPETPIESGSNS